MKNKKILIIGGGVIGLGIGWQLAKAGTAVTILARYPEWVDALETETEMSIGYQAEGTLIIGIAPDDAYQLPAHRVPLPSLARLSTQNRDGSKTDSRTPSPRVKVSRTVSVERKPACNNGASGAKTPKQKHQDRQHNARTADTPQHFTCFASQ